MRMSTQCSTRMLVFYTFFFHKNTILTALKHYLKWSNTILKRLEHLNSIIADNFDMFILSNIYIFIAIALDESIFLDVHHFPMKNIKSRDLEAMGGATSKPIQ